MTSIKMYSPITAGLELSVCGGPGHIIIIRPTVYDLHINSDLHAIFYFRLSAFESFLE